MATTIKSAETVVVPELELAISKLALEPKDVLVLQSEDGIDQELLLRIKEHITKVRPELAGNLILFGIRAGMDTMSVIHEGSLTTTAEMRTTTLPPRVFNLVIGDPLTDVELQRLRQEFNATVVVLPQAHINVLKKTEKDILTVIEASDSLETLTKGLEDLQSNADEKRGQVHIPVGLMCPHDLPSNDGSCLHSAGPYEPIKEAKP